MSNLVAIAQLKPGMVILSITQQNGPVKIRKSGLVTSDAMVQGLMEMGVQEVEIDPEQTVEIAPTTQHRTQTQALLRGDRDTNAQIDNTLSEQFNRSLFLPTVQGLPSVWKRYGKDAAVYAVLIVGGSMYWLHHSYVFTMVESIRTYTGNAHSTDNSTFSCSQSNDKCCPVAA